MNILVSIMIQYYSVHRAIVQLYSHTFLTLYLSTCICAMKRENVIFTKKNLSLLKPNSC